MQRRSFLALAAGLAAAPAPLARAWASPLEVRRLDLVNAHTGETFKGPYRDAKGLIADALEELCHFLRDFHCGEKTEIDECGGLGGGRCDTARSGGICAMAGREGDREAIRSWLGRSCPRSPGQVFYGRLQEVLTAGGFDLFVATACPP
jgi:Bacterial protein of unknown function (DUF882)